MTRNIVSNDVVSKEYDLLLNCLMQWGSLDVWHMVEKAVALEVNMYDLAEILQTEAEEQYIDLYNGSTDLNALFNNYIIRMASCDILDSTDIDIDCDFGVYFFQNYLDDPLQYTKECVEVLQNTINERGLKEDDFNNYSLYILEIMGITFNESENE